MGCGGSVEMPKGKGASGSATEVSKEPSAVDQAKKDAKPGSGMGVGGGDGMGRFRNSEGGKAKHERGTGEKKRAESGNEIPTKAPDDPKANPKS